MCLTLTLTLTIHILCDLALSGDIRVNEQMALSSMHTVWLRQHNRLTSQLSELNPHWDDERLFQVSQPSQIR